jgi:hypothetical protein
MIDRKPRARIMRTILVNQMPINRAAAQFLPDQKPLETEPAVLTLIRWGLENGIVPVPAAPGHPNEDSMMAQVIEMATTWQPRNAVKFLTNPEGPDDTVLTAEELAAQPSAEDAAELLIENLYNAMVANAP